MRPPTALRGAAGAALVGLAGWLAANAMAHGAPAGAQTPSPTVEIRRAQEARFLPRPDRNRPIFILAIGSDARPGQPVTQLRADSIHIVAVNPRRGAATILGFPRDSYVPIPGVGTRKINDAMVAGGPELVVQTVESLTGIPIDYWMVTSFQGFVKMVNAVDGLVIDVRYPMHDRAAGTTFDPGRQRLGGQQALAFARDRHSTPGGDFGRSENQGRLMVAAHRKLLREFRRDPARLFTWIQAGVRNVETDLSLGEILDLAFLALQVNPRRVDNLVAPGTTGSAGGASVVFLSPSAREIYADIRDNAILNR